MVKSILNDHKDFNDYLKKKTNKQNLAPFLSKVRRFFYFLLSKNFKILKAGRFEQQKKAKDVALGPGFSIEPSEKVWNKPSFNVLYASLN